MISLRSRRLEVVGTKKKRARTPRVRPFSLSPTTSKRLLRRLQSDMCLIPSTRALLYQTRHLLFCVKKLYAKGNKTCVSFFPYTVDTTLFCVSYRVFHTLVSWYTGFSLYKKFMIFGYTVDKEGIFKA